VNDLLAQFSQGQTAGFLLVLARVSPLFLLAPLFSSRTMPPRAKGIAAVAIALGIAPLAMRGHEVPLDALTLGELAVKELFVGLAFAFAIAALFAALQAAGSLLDTFTGFAYAAIVDPLTGNQSAVIHHIYTMIGVAIFVAIGGDAWVIQGLARTYDAVPLLSQPDLGAIVAGANEAFVSIFRAAVEVCAPVMIALVLTDAAFGLVSRVVPQLNVFAVGFPAKIVVGLALLGVTLPFAADWFSNELQSSVRAALQTLRVA
jgi:flagellar biosynthetic protein FliR